VKKTIVLVVLVFQNALLILSMRYTRVGDGPMYLTTTAVAISEFSKMVICSAILLVEHIWSDKTVSDYLSYMYQSLVGNWQDTLKLSIPALVYAFQNNLQYVAVSNLDAAVFQVLYQLKIFTTALFSVAMLGRALLRIQWLSLLLLFVGVSLVTVDMTGIKTSVNEHAHNSWIGVIAVIISCLSSGFAGVYFEQVLKTSNSSGEQPSVWLRNVQLGIFGSSSAVIGMLVKDGDRISAHGFLHGYSGTVWFVILQQAVGGLIVALVVKFADNILKGYATSLSIIISAVVSVFLFSFSLTPLFGIGTGITIAATVLYGWKPSEKNTISVNSDSKADKA
jgi:UDP-galactose transporter